MGYTFAMNKTQSTLEDRKELEEFVRRFNLLRREFPNVEINSESGFEAVEVSVNSQIEYIPRKIE